jgi:hypothetical protein
MEKRGGDLEMNSKDLNRKRSAMTGNEVERSRKQTHWK